MGVPAFYRWIREKFPKCIEDCVEDMPPLVDGREGSVDVGAANPNGIEFDALYVDMNGVIHPCVHPEDVPAPTTEEEMFAAVVAYVDRLVAAVRPRKLLYLAIDGVAPRAKMNQQRSRRFKAAHDMAEEEEVEDRLRAKLAERGQRVPPKKAGGHFDHNVITPGTRFMDRLAAFLRYHVTARVNSRAGWRDVKVVISDASVPGEGEHKIMEYIRQQRAQPGYNPNTVHCIHGLDADLIMLALASHEPRFSILREDVLGKPSTKCHVCGRDGHRADQCTGAVAPPPSWEAAAAPAAAAAAAGGAGAAAGPSGLHPLLSQRSLIQRKPLQFLHLPILREYLDLEFRPSLAPRLPPGFAAEDAALAAAAAAIAGVAPPPVLVPSTGAGASASASSALSASSSGGGGYSLESVIDDFIFLCFFVGNDFLPHLPSLDIREGAIDLLLALYKQILPSLGGYLTAHGHVLLARVDVLLSRLGAVEGEIFRRRRVKEEREAARDADRKAQEQRRNGNGNGGRGAGAAALAITDGDADADAAAAGGAGGKGGSRSVGAGSSASSAAATRAYRAATTAAEFALREGVATLGQEKRKQQVAAAASAAALASVSVGAAATGGSGGAGAGAGSSSSGSAQVQPPPAKRRHLMFGEGEGEGDAAAAAAAAAAAGAAAAGAAATSAGSSAAAAPSKPSESANRSAAQALRSQLLGGGKAAVPAAVVSVAAPATAAAMPADDEGSGSEEGEGVAAGSGTGKGSSGRPSERESDLYIGGAFDAADPLSALAIRPTHLHVPLPKLKGSGAGAGAGADEGPKKRRREEAPEAAGDSAVAVDAEAGETGSAAPTVPTVIAESALTVASAATTAVSIASAASGVASASSGAGGTGTGTGTPSEASDTAVTPAPDGGSAPTAAAAAAAAASSSEGSANAMGGDDEDDDAEAAALEAEALEEGVVEAEVASAISGILKVSVLKALLDKRTHEGVVDEVQLGGRAGWRERYYSAKFGPDNASSSAFMNRLIRDYVQGLVWVYRYYFQGVPSWTWYYPYHYAPFAADLRGLAAMGEPGPQGVTRFELGKPFRPLDQLMGVLPPRSAHALPAACSALMREASSPVKDFYPESFDMDANGKRFTWQWVVLLPFIEEGRLIAAIDSVASTFTEEERRRNCLGSDILIMHKSVPVARFILPLLKLPMPGATAPAAAPAAGATGAAEGAGAASGSSSAIVPAAAPAPPAPPAGTIPVVTLKPTMGDPAGKGMTAQIVRVCDSPAGKRGVVAPALGGVLPPPTDADASVPPLMDVHVVMVAVCPPPRRTHLCSLLPGVEPTLAVLDPRDDDPSGRVPRLTRGMSVVDLAYAMAAETHAAAQAAALTRAVSGSAVGQAMLGGGLHALQGHGHGHGPSAGAGASLMGAYGGPGPAPGPGPGRGLMGAAPAPGGHAGTAPAPSGPGYGYGHGHGHGAPGYGHAAPAGYAPAPAGYGHGHGYGHGYGGPAPGPSAAGMTMTPGQRAVLSSLGIAGAGAGAGAAPGAGYPGAHMPMSMPMPMGVPMGMGMGMHSMPAHAHSHIPAAALHAVVGMGPGPGPVPYGGAYGPAPGQGQGPRLFSFGHGGVGAGAGLPPPQAGGAPRPFSFRR